MILERYIVREISVPLVALCGVMIVIFAGFSAIHFLNDAVNGLLSGATVAALVALRVLIAFEVLLPVTLYLSVVLGLGRLHADSEITGMEACGIGQGRIVAPVLLLALLFALVVTGMSLYGRPWAYAKIYALESRAESEFDFAKIEAGRFYELSDGVVFFAAALDPARRQARDVHIWDVGAGKREVTTAQDAHQVDGPGPGQRSIVFRDGSHYELNLETNTDLIIRFRENVYRLKARTPTPEYRRKAALTAQLARSPNPRDIAELQWRLSTGLSTVLMALLAIPLSRVAPRRGKYGKATAAIVLFFVFYNLMLIAKTMVEKQAVGPMPGLWWVNGLEAALVLALLPHPSPFLRRPVRAWLSRRRGKP